MNMNRLFVLVFVALLSIHGNALRHKRGGMYTTPEATSNPVTVDGVDVRADHDTTTHMGGVMPAAPIDPKDTVATPTVTATEGESPQNMFEANRIDTDGNTNGAAKVVDEQHPASPLVDEHQDGPQTQPNHDKCEVSPCDKLNGVYHGLQPAYIVDKLSSSSKKFVPKPVKKRASLWDELNEADGIDPEMIRLKAKLNEIDDNMNNAKNWIKEVHMIINHYHKKIGSVALGLKYEARDANKLRQLIKTRHQINERKRLEHKLEQVNKRIQEVTEEARVTGGHHESLTDLRAHLKKKISHLQSEIGSAHSGLISTAHFQ